MPANWVAAHRAALVVATSLVLGAVLVQPVAAQATDAEQVLEQFERAFNAHDEQAVVGLFVADGTIRDGQAAAEVITSDQMPDWVRRGAARNLHVHMGNYTSSGGETHFAIEVGQGEWYRNGSAALRATGTAEVRNGRIVSLVMLQSPQVPMRDVVAGRESSTAIPVVPALVAGVGLLVLVGGVAHRTARHRRSPSDVRTTSGALHTALGTWSSARRRAAE